MLVLTMSNVIGFFQFWHHGKIIVQAPPHILTWGRRNMKWNILPLIF